MMRSLHFCSLLSIAVLGFAYAQNEVLAPGSPPLTRTMIDQRIWVLETFLDIHLTPEQRERFARATTDAWKNGNMKVVQYTLSDLKLYGKEGDVKALKPLNQEPYVDRMRNEPDDPLNQVLLQAFDAAHPDRKDVMHERGLSNLLGKWERGDAMTPPRNPVTGRVAGVSFTDALVLNIFTDGHFQHLWSHSHCSNGTCCREYGTAASGTVAVQGSKLVLNAASGNLFSKDACLPAGNTSQPMPPKTQNFDYSVHMDKGRNVPVLCLSDRPFQFDDKQPPQPFCYTKQ
jgi:hypothetical protein